MKNRGATRRAAASDVGFYNSVFFLLSLASIILILAPHSAPAASDLTSATQDISERLTAEVTATPEGGGRVIFVVPPVGLVVEFERPGAHSNREYLLTRQPEKAKEAFPVVIGVVRLSAVREEQARGVVLWATTTPRPGDKLIPPDHITIFILPAKDLAHHPDASGPVVEQAFEIALSHEKKLRVVRLESKPDPEQLAKRLQIAGETGVLLKPVVLPDPGGVRIAVKALSVLSGHTLASYDESIKLAPRIARPAPAPPPAPRASHQQGQQAQRPAEGQAVQTAPPPRAQADTAPPGIVFTKKEAEPGEIVVEGEKPGPVRNQVEEQLVAIAAANLDGEGRPELVAISEKGVFTYRWTDRGFAGLTGYLEPDKFVQYLSVDAADINGNGRDEIFVTALSSVAAGLEFRNRLRSLVLELDGRRLKPIASELPYFLRVTRVPGQKRPLLLAQKMGRNDPFVGPVLTMTWDGNRYVEKEPLALPGKAAWLYEFSILEMGDEGATAVTAVNWKGRLLVRRNGEEVWTGKENLGRIEHASFLQTPRSIRPPEGLRQMTQPRTEKIAERRVLSRRILAARPLFGTGKIELITVANRARYGLQVRLFGEAFGAASVVGYVDSGDKFEKNWETEPIEGEARDLTLADFDGDGRRDVVLLSAMEDHTSLNLFLLRRRKGA
ncbi:MAG: FG-GAP repeat domain-containing protein [Candidatus Methylomirabilales bacterium]